MLFSAHYASLPFTEKLLTMLPFIIGSPIIAGIDWLRLMQLGWVTLSVPC